MRTKSALDRYVRDRWPRWLASKFAQSSVRPSQLADALGSLTDDPENRDKAPRSAVSAWLAGKRYISPAKAFEVGRALALVEGVDLVPGGIVALHGAGHFNECIATIIYFLSQAESDEAPVLYDNGKAVTRSQADIADARRRTEYGLNLVAALWCAHADLDRLRKPLAPEMRECAKAMIGSAPLEACQRAWERSLYGDKITFPSIGFASQAGGGIYTSALCAWSWLFEVACQRTLRGSTSLRFFWADKQEFHNAYMESAHDSLMAPQHPTTIGNPDVNARGKHE